MDDKGLDLWDFYERDRSGPTMREVTQYIRDQQRSARLALHARAAQIAERLMTLERVKRVLADDDLELDFLGADIPGLSLARVMADARCEETELRREFEDIQRDPNYQAA